MPSCHPMYQSVQSEVLRLGLPQKKCLELRSVGSDPELSSSAKLLGVSRHVFLTSSIHGQRVRIDSIMVNPSSWVKSLNLWIKLMSFMVKSLNLWIYISSFMALFPWIQSARNILRWSHDSIRVRPRPPPTWAWTTVTKRLDLDPWIKPCMSNG